MEKTDATDALRKLIDDLPDPLAREAFTHASWSEHRAESYERLAFLGDSVLSLAMTTQLFERSPAQFGAGRLTKVRAQTVSGRACARVAMRLELPDRLAAGAPPEAQAGLDALVHTERVLASVIEAAIGACYSAFGFQRTASAVVDAFSPELEDALDHSVDYKSSLQEALARRGDVVTYEVIEELGPPHDRTFEVVARIGGEEAGRGSGRSKKEAEQGAARAVLESIS